MLSIDGSRGEGGGQILRSSLALAMVTGQPCRIERIRAGRRKPGLLRQHLTAVMAAAEVADAQVNGAVLGSQTVELWPGRVRPGSYHFAVGTAGSSTLVLQTVLPALLTASGPSQLTLEGGTHNPHAPPFDFLVKSFLPLIERLGARVQARLERPGFYPRGGGRWLVSIEPAPRLQPLHLHQRGAIRRQSATAMVAGLPRQIAERELRTVAEQLGWSDEQLSCQELAPQAGPGNVLLLEIVHEQVTELFTGFGERGVPAERVAATTVQQVQRYLAAGVPVGEHLADQLLLPLAIAGGGSFQTLAPSRHTRTNREVVECFTGLQIDLDELAPDCWQVALTDRRATGPRQP